MILFYPIRNGLIECRYFSIIFLYGQIDEDARRIQPFRTVVSVRSCFNNDVVTVLPYVNGVVVDVLVGIGLVFTTTCIITVDYGASVAAYRVKQFIGISQITRNVVFCLDGRTERIVLTRLSVISTHARIIIQCNKLCLSRVFKEFPLVLFTFIQSKTQFSIDYSRNVLTHYDIVNLITGSFTFFRISCIVESNMNSLIRIIIQIHDACLTKVSPVFCRFLRNCKLTCHIIPSRLSYILTVKIG